MCLYLIDGSRRRAYKFHVSCTTLHPGPPRPHHQEVLLRRFCAPAHHSLDPPPDPLDPTTPRQSRTTSWSSDGSRIQLFGLWTASGLLSRVHDTIVIYMSQFQLRFVCKILKSFVTDQSWLSFRMKCRRILARVTTCWTKQVEVLPLWYKL